MTSLLRRKFDLILKTETKRALFRRLLRFPKESLAYHMAWACSGLFSPVRVELLESIATMIRADALGVLCREHSRLLRRGAAKKWLIAYEGDNRVKTWQFNPAFARNRHAVDFYTRTVRLNRRIVKAQKAKS